MATSSRSSNVRLDVFAAETQLKERQRDVDYDTKDFTIDYIVRQFQDGLFFIPEYQREFVWKLRQRRRFVESVLLGLPIPFVFVAELDDGRLEIVDGAQRIQTLEQFVGDDLQLMDLTKLPALNGFRFKDLPIPQQRKFANRALRMIVLDSTTSLEVRQDIFDRINTGNSEAKPSEVRKGAFGGPFYKVIQDCAADAAFGRLCPITASVRMRGEAEELTLRFFAYSDRYQRFRHDVAAFLDDYILETRKSFHEGEMRERFASMIRFVARHFPYGFAKFPGAQTTPRVRFEAISVGVYLATQIEPDLEPLSMAWLESTEFKQHTTTHASNSGPKLRARIEYVRDRLLDR